MIGRSIFVNDFFNQSRLQHLFGDLGRIKEECRTLLSSTTEKSSLFTLPIYVSKPNFLDFSPENDSMVWRAVLPSNLNSSFIGVFCACQHLVKVRVAWKCVESGQIDSTEAEIFFKVLQVRTKAPILGIIDCETKESSFDDADELFPDDFDCKNEVEYSKLFELIKRRGFYSLNINNDNNNSNTNITNNNTNNNNNHNYNNLEELARLAVESDAGFNGLLNIPHHNHNNNQIKLGSIHVRKTVLFPGTQIFITITDLPSGLEAIKLALECIETYPKKYLKSGDSFVWREPVKMMELKPHKFQDRLDSIPFPVPPELFPSISTDFFELEWELAVDFHFENGQKFGMKVPLQLMAFKLDKYIK